MDGTEIFLDFAYLSGNGNRAAALTKSGLIYILDLDDPNKKLQQL